MDENRFEWRLEVEEDLTAVKQAAKNRNTEEVEAESISYAVCQYFGIQTGENSFGYIASWSKDKELKELRASLETINKTSCELINDIERNYKEICKERGIELEQENAPKISANFEGLDTPEQFAAALYDYMAELEAAGMLQHPYSLDPREQAIVEIMEELRAGRIIITIDDPDRENEGDMICAAQFATTENVNFMATHLPLGG